MIPLNIQPVSGDNLNMLSLDSTLQLAQGKSSTVPVESSFSSYMERAAKADSTDGNNQTQQITHQDDLSQAESVEVSFDSTVNTEEKLVAFENQLARMAELSALQEDAAGMEPADFADLEPFTLEVSFDEEGELYSGVHISFSTESENQIDAEIDRFLGLSEESMEPEETVSDSFLKSEVASENVAAAISLPSQPVLNQNLTAHNDSDKQDSIASIQDGEKKAGKTNKNGTVMNSIEIVDERTFEAPEENKTVTMTSFDGNNKAEMSLNLGQQAENQYFQDNQTGAYTGNIEAGITRTDFASMISEEIKSNAGEFVKTGSIVLQNDNKGTINLILHPEQLGNVKIRLELSDNQITGKIVVASKEAYDAFKQSMNELKQAFIASGFETNGFDLTWTGSQGSSQQGNQENQDRIYENLNAALAQRSSDSYLDNMPDAPIETSGSSTTYINLVA